MVSDGSKDYGQQCGFPATIWIIEAMTPKYSVGLWASGGSHYPKAHGLVLLGNDLLLCLLCPKWTHDFHTRIMEILILQD